MDLKTGPADAIVRDAPLVRFASIAHDHPHATRALAEQIGVDDLALIVFMVSPQADHSAILAEAASCCPGAHVVGCTTAGEITETGYGEGQIVVVGFPRQHFVARTLLIEDLDAYDVQDTIDRMIQTRSEMAEIEPEWRHEFNFLLIDGLSTKEDRLVADLAVGLGSVPLFGGSAGDGTRFGTAYVLHGDEVHSNAAVLTQIRTRCPVRVFKTDHFVPTEQRMVVTGADPARRIVTEINAEPAAQEYARILGKDPGQLTTFTFAAHPVVVRIGGQHHVRSIQRMDDNGDLVFFSAIDEGLVLTLAEPRDMVAHLRDEMSRLRDPATPEAILACDCLLRRLEAEQNQMIGALSGLLRDNRVIGFSTYGEQFNSMHVNQTLTGVAIYRPEDIQP